MKADLQCYQCCMKKAVTLLEQYEVPEEKSIPALKKVLAVLSAVEDEETAPMMMMRVMQVLEEAVGISNAYEVPKRKYNTLLLEKEPEIAQRIKGAQDPFAAGLHFAALGNYIDFGAMDTVDDHLLEHLLEKADEIHLDPKEQQHLKEDLEKAKRLVYITDNAGEIVMDKLFLRQLKQQYPNLSVTILVRGKPVLNDATKRDAEWCGLDQVGRVMENGTGIPGTQLDAISKEALEAVEQADLCIAKGQGNFETLRGSGKNIYYIFLCKCDLFVKKFSVEPYTAILANEKRIVQYR